MILFVIFDEKRKSDRGLIFLHFFRLTCLLNVNCYLWCRREKLLPMVSFFLPLVLLPLVQFSNQRQEFLPMVHSCLWCCNNRPPYILAASAQNKNRKSMLFILYRRRILAKVSLSNFTSTGCLSLEITESE